MRTLVLVAAAMAAASAAPASAGGLGYEQMAAGDFGSAEQQLGRQHALSPDQPELALNLAAVYVYTNRAAEARTLYRDVLAHNPVDLTLASGATVSSHLIARRGLARLARTTIASN